MATILYDGTGRRIGKRIFNSGDGCCTPIYRGWNCLYHDYVDGQSVIETRDSANQEGKGKREREREGKRGRECSVEKSEVGGV